MNETVSSSSDPDSAAGTGTGGSSGGATPPPPADEGASTGGLGTQSEQHGSGAPSGQDAPLHLSEGAVADDQEPQSPSGT